MNFFLNHLNSQCFKKTTNKQKKKNWESFYLHRWDVTLPPEGGD